MITYRKTKAGEWVAFGPAIEVNSGSVTISKKDGSTKVETIEHISKPFDVDGVPHVYGFLGKRAENAGRVRGRRTGCSCGSREDSHGDLIPSDRNCRSCEHDA